MPRPREFDEDRALDAAMRAFWSEGYEATSTQDLCEATGLGRSSIYNTFRSKRDLFEQALTRYMTERTATTLALLADARPVREKVRTLLWQSVDPPEDDPLGCLVVNSLVELGPRDEHVAALLRTDQDRRFAALRDAFTAGRAAGEVAADKDPAALAHFVVSSINGMRVMARAGADRATIESVARTALSAI
ncbi:TetR/AcrR family transcriptional regulator [Actinophytocola sp. NPDC049390]|uniref:TetR/AcrR family transcriptional regulator n=1 Tax=Actinophytocola sp. NPDC049390 TaxID=3363894 RepID=UPI0037BD9781